MTVSPAPHPSGFLFGTAVVAGVGLIGGSVALGLRQRLLARRVIGLDASMDVLRDAEALGVVDEVRAGPGEWLRQADLVVLAAPMRALAESLQSTCSSRCGFCFAMRARPAQSAWWMVTPRPSVR